MKPILVCAQDFSHLPEARACLERTFALRMIAPITPEQLARTGIIGCGRLGTIVSQYARAFRMTVLGYDVRDDVRIENVTRVGLDELLSRSDVVSLHIHLTDANRHFINRERLRRMKPGSILVNTSRGAIVDETAVLQALENGPLVAYGSDVIDGEWRDDLDRHPLIRQAREHDNVVITPHIGGATYESQAMAYGHVARMLTDFWKRRW